MLLIRNPEGATTSFEIQKFEYRGALSRCYVLLVEILDLDDLLQEINPLLHPAVLQYEDSLNEPAYCSGVITAFNLHIDPVKQQKIYEVQIEPFLGLLALERKFRVYNQQSPLEICQRLIQDLIQKYHLSDYADFQISDSWLTTALRTHDVNAEAHHLDYFQKLLSTAHYYFQQSPSGEKLKVIDQPSLLPTRKQTLMLDPNRKEDVQDGAPVFYAIQSHFKSQSLRGKPYYFDSFNPQASLKSIQTGEALVFETALFAPSDWQEYLQTKLTEQLSHDHEIYSFQSYYSSLMVGERITLESQLGQHFDTFIESLTLEGFYQNQAWRFDVKGKMRHYRINGPWLGAYLARKKGPAIFKGAILQDSDQVNDDGFYQVKLPVGFNVGETRPIISVREIQETVTRDGGASHAVSGTADSVLISQDGMPSDLLLLGSVIDTQRNSHIGLDNYRETGIQMQGGLKFHMRRQDPGNDYGELGIHLENTQGHSTQFILGANTQTLSEQDDLTHGIIQQSTSYAKRVVSGNDYHTVGDVDQPTVQGSLVKISDALPTQKSDLLL